MFLANTQFLLTIVYQITITYSNSRFKQNAFKFSFGYSMFGLQNILRYQRHSEVVGIPAHIHGDPTTVELYDLTSSSIDFNDYKPTRPTQFITNNLITHESKYL